MTDRDDKPIRIPIDGPDESPPENEEESSQPADTAKQKPTEAERGDAEKGKQAEGNQQAAEQQEQEETEDWKARYEEEREKRLRAAAELKNYRRRSNERQAQQRRFANETLLADLLNLLDNFDQALCSLDAEEGSAETVLQGVEMIHRQLQELTQRHGVTEIEAAGSRFDPNYHEAVERVETDETPDMTVLEVTSPGYMLYDRVLRPARVRVAVSPEEQEGAQQTETQEDTGDEQ